MAIYKDEFLRLLCIYFDNKLADFLSVSSRHRGITSELKTKIKEAISPQKG